MTPAFVGRRLLGLVVTLLVASVVIFGSLYLSPGDPAALLAGGSTPNPEALAQIRADFHLNDPFWSQYWHWLSGLLQGDLGRSVVFRSDVVDLLASRVVTSLMLVVYAATLIIVIGVGLGSLAALRGGRISTAVTVVTTIGMAAPTFVAAIVFVWLFSTQLGWFPIYGSGSGLVDRLWHLTLPAVALSLTWIAYVSRITRSAVSAELESEHVVTATSRGLPRRSIVRHHVMRNAAAPVLTISGLTVAGLFAGTAVAEQAFGVNGIGALLIDCAAKQDLAVVQVIAMFMVAAFVVINTVVDVISAALDPRLVASAVDA
ncbi:ABC transporter permease [Aeromicrobium endophyticum]|uniref:ABC transporter permease n=1 Tax=Aeromicrobium endophyticum TaxID=2292704 RepID=A0A371PDW3_9ACTN|nr:ABC transporter permease [Aeromicrobium endophyticum]